MSGLTPEQLFNRLRSRYLDVAQEAVQEFAGMPAEARQEYLAETVRFVWGEPSDAWRSWGTTVLRHIGGPKAYAELLKAVTGIPAPERTSYPQTRFFALLNAYHLADGIGQCSSLGDVCRKVLSDAGEHPFLCACAQVILASRDHMQVEAVREVLAAKESGTESRFTPLHGALHALEEIPVPRVTAELIDLARRRRYWEIRFHATRALGRREYRDDPAVVRALGEIAATDALRSLRLVAIDAIGEVGNRDAQSDLLRAFHDRDSEIRERAAMALKRLVSTDEAVALIANEALRKGIDQRAWGRLVGALRLADLGREVSARVLGSEIDGPDPERAFRARQILTELGGTAAVQRLAQRRRTLSDLDAMLKASEEAVKDTFERSMSQARAAYHFSMSVNAAIFLAGFSMLALGIWELAGGTVTWQALLGPAGLAQVILYDWLNGPRRNARRDLAALMNVKVIFLGFLRQLNQIDATFKHAYLEDESFSVDQMTAMVSRLRECVDSTLEAMARHLEISAEPAPAKPAAEEEPGPDGSPEGTDAEGPTTEPPPNVPPGAPADGGSEGEEPHN